VNDGSQSIVYDDTFHFLVSLVFFSLTKKMKEFGYLTDFVALRY